MSTRPLLAILTLLLGHQAWAGCDKDTDCKGDRICEDGVCVDPSSSAPSTASHAPSARTPEGITAQDIKFANGRVKDIRRRELIGWAAAGQGLLFGTVGSVLGLAQVEWYIAVPPGIVGLGSLAVGAPITSGGGRRGREALRSLGAPVPGPGLQIAGWSCFGTSMLLGLTGIGMGIGQDSAGGAVGLGAVFTGAASTILFDVDAANTRRRLQERVKALSKASPPKVQPGLWVGPEASGGSVAVAW